MNGERRIERSTYLVDRFEKLGQAFESEEFALQAGAGSVCMYSDGDRKRKSLAATGTHSNGMRQRGACWMRASVAALGTFWQGCVNMCVPVVQFIVGVASTIDC